MSATNNDTTSQNSTATVGDVHGVIKTNLDQSRVVAKLEDAWYEAQRVNDLEEMDDIDVHQLEKYLAAYLIRAMTDRAIASGDRQLVSLEYEGSSLDELRQQVRRRDPSGELPGDPNVTRRTADHVGSARPHSEDNIGLDSL